MPTALILDDDKANRALLRFHCHELGFETEEFNDPKALLKRLDRTDGAEIVLLDIMMPDMDGFEILALIRERHHSIPVIMVTAREDPDSIIRCLRLGATDYLPKGFDAPRLHASLSNAQAMLSLREQLRETKAALQSLVSVGHFVAHSAQTLEITRMLSRVKDTDATVLFLGESGVGKEIFARYTHFESRRRHHPFIAVNCAAIPETLFESELFGHQAGAFTGATERRVGKFEAAKSGTIFLDEIGEMSPNVQARLLRVLQDKVVSPIGGNREVPIHARVICATNKNLVEEVGAGRFRNDLFYRLNTFPVPIPPLRERRDEIRPLAAFFLDKYRAELNRDNLEMSEKAVAAMLAYQWPGNIRELENCIRRATLICEDTSIGVEHLMLGAGSDRYPALAASFADEAGSLSAGPSSRPEDVRSVEEVDHSVMLSAVKACEGDISDAARRLGISRSTVYARLKKYGINPKIYR